MNRILEFKLFDIFKRKKKEEDHKAAHEIARRFKPMIDFKLIEYISDVCTTYIDEGQKIEVKVVIIPILKPKTSILDADWLRKGLDWGNYIYIWNLEKGDSYPYSDHKFAFMYMSSSKRNIESFYNRGLHENCEVLYEISTDPSSKSAESGKLSQNEMNILQIAKRIRNKYKDIDVFYPPSYLQTRNPRIFIRLKNS